MPKNTYVERTVYIPTNKSIDLLAAANDLDELQSIEMDFYLARPEGMDESDLVKAKMLFTPTQAKAIDKQLTRPRYWTTSRAKAKQVQKRLLEQIEESSKDYDDETYELLEDVLGEGLKAIHRRGGAVDDSSKVMRTKLSKAQMKEMKGRGFFSDIGKALTSVASSVVDAIAPGVGSALETPVNLLIDEIDDAITGKGMMDARDLQRLKGMLTKKNGGALKKRDRSRQPLSQRLADL